MKDLFAIIQIYFNPPCTAPMISAGLCIGNRGSCTWRVNSIAEA